MPQGGFHMTNYTLTPDEARTWDAAYRDGLVAVELTASLKERFGAVVDYESEHTTTILHPDGFVICFFSPFTCDTRVMSTEDGDMGYVREPSDHERRIPHGATDVLVAWDQGVATWTPAASLEAL